MNIIILGAGQVGTSVATSLAHEDNDITVVDTDRFRLAELREKVDLRTIEGHGATPETLARAGAGDADLIIAVTSSDEVNMIACAVAGTLFRTSLRIARVRHTDYLDHPQLTSSMLGINKLISPEKLVTDHVTRLIESPGALQVLDFADGRAQLVAVRAFEGGLLVGHELRTLREHLPPGTDARVAAIFRNGKPVRPDGDTRIQVDDEVFFLAEQRHIRVVMQELRRAEKPARRIIIAGGGNIGRALARNLESHYSVKIIERQRERAHLIGEDLQSAIVLVGDCTDEALLREENIDQTDVYCALTNDDESNILSAMLAKKMGAVRVVSLINRPTYADLVVGHGIDIAVSPQLVTLGHLLAFIRGGSVSRVHSLRRGTAEAIEAKVMGTRQNSSVAGRRIDEIDLPSDTNIGGIVRGDQLIIAHHDTVIESGDHVIIFIWNKSQVKHIQHLFRVAPTL